MSKSLTHFCGLSPPLFFLLLLLHSRNMTTSPHQQRPPHRPGLSSIDNDDWDEGQEEQQQPSSHKGRTVKHSHGSHQGRHTTSIGRQQQQYPSSSDPYYHLHHYGEREEDVARVVPRGRGDGDRRRNRNAERAVRTGEASSDSAISFRYCLFWGGGRGKTLSYIVVPNNSGCLT
jgi:hypothetical protein